MRIILINLDQDTGRRRRVEGRLREIGLDWERLPANDSARLASSHEARVDREEQAARGLRISPGEIGCWLSHRAAQRMIAEGSERMALILEDDLDIHEGLPDMLVHMEHGEAGCFDVAYLHRHKLKRRYVPIRRFGREHTLGFVHPADSGTLACVMTRLAFHGNLKSALRTGRLSRLP